MILFCTNDAGPAENLSVLIHEMRNSDIVVFSGPVSCRTFAERGIESIMVSRPYDVSEIDRALTAYKPSLLITGTSWGDALEKYFLKAANNKKVRAISIIENWAWYREGFELDGSMVLPDHIIVNDEIARHEAIQSGLPVERVCALGNLFFERKASATNVAVPKRQWMQQLKLPEKKIIVFISEDYSRDFPRGSGHYQGFDEYRVVRDILSVMTDGEHLLIKLHPSEQTDKYDAFKGDRVTVIGSTDIDSLIANVEIIIGMGSMLLVEASLHRNDVVSYRPDAQCEFIGNRLGSTLPVADKTELGAIISGTKRIKNRGMGQVFDGSTNRIVEFIKGLIV